MGLIEAVRRCFARYATFSGRARRAEFWKFVLFLLLVHIALIVLNSMIFGPTITEEFGININDAGQQTPFVKQKMQYNGGWFSNVFILATLLPFLAVAWRRMHDTGRPGWYLLLPLVVVPVSFWLAFQTGTSVPIDQSLVPEGIAMPESMNLPSAGVFVIAWLVSFASYVLVIVWLARRSQPEPNRFGPVPDGIVIDSDQR